MQTEVKKMIEHGSFSVAIEIPPTVNEIYVATYSSEWEKTPIGILGIVEYDKNGRILVDRQAFKTYAAARKHAAEFLDIEVKYI